MSSARVRIPLYAKILGWMVLNVALAFGILYAFAARDQSGLNRLLTQSVRERVASIARSVGDEIYDLSDAEHAETLRRAGQQYGVRFSARDALIPRVESPPHLRSEPPPEFNEDGGPPHPEAPNPAWRDGPHAPDSEPPTSQGPPGLRAGPGPRNVFIDVRRARTEPGYEIAVDLEIAQRGKRPRPIRMLAHADSLPALFRFLGIGRELILLAAVLVFSALFWWPFVWHITSSIRQLLAATQQMALGKLDTRVPTGRRDELGHLAVAVNTMGERLQAYLQGQRQFMADIAHEVISPVSRIQIGLGILEPQVPARGAATLNDIREDLDQMSGMLNELLLFSRSGIESDRAPATVELRKLVEDVAESEPGTVPVSIEIPAELQARGHASMIQRALANLVRNAQRYATGTTSPIEIAGWADERGVHLTVRDRGPGVPDSALERLGEPFFRPESARSRATGGFGLGLAIVRRCVAACDGEVWFRNRVGGGFEVEIVLPHTG